jgi:hypothetical protein
MNWQRLATQPLDLDAGVTAARALAIAEALWRRVVPLLVLRAGRPEPLASAVLYEHRRHLLLATCAHVFDCGSALGDLAVPLGDSGALLPLREAEARLVLHESQDVAVVAIGSPRAAARLRTCWRTQALGPQPVPAAARSMFVIAGYPYAQMRRVDGVLYARPLVAFARALDERMPIVGYPRIARRGDGLEVRAPELDGVSGATLWRVQEGGATDIDCVLHAGGVQVAFKPGAYARGEPIEAVFDLAHRLAH